MSLAPIPCVPAWAAIRSSEEMLAENLPVIRYPQAIEEETPSDGGRAQFCLHTAIQLKTG